MRALIGVVILIVCIKGMMGLTDKAIKSYNDEGKAVDACLFNPAYQGNTPEDTRALYQQCLADFKESR